YSEASCEESPPSLAPPPSLPPLSLPPLSLPPLSLCSTARVLPSSSPVSPPHPARAGTSTAPAAISAADRRRPRACTMGTSSDQRQAHTVARRGCGLKADGPCEARTGGDADGPVGPARRGSAHGLRERAPARWCGAAPGLFSPMKRAA